MIGRLWLWAAAVGWLAVPARAHVGLETPAGGETYMPGEVVVVKWKVQIQHPQENWDLYFSSDGGITWASLALNMPVSQLTYSWTVPQLNTTRARIRIVMDNSGPDYEAVSGDFTIGSGMPFVIVSPQAGDTWLSGSTGTITWEVNSGVTVDYWNLDWSDDEGQTWQALAADLAAPTRSYTWQIPPVSTAGAVIRLSLYEGNNIFEAYSGTFTIDQTITGLPDPGPAWRLYPNPATVSVSWQAPDPGVATVRFYTVDGRLALKVVTGPAPQQELDIGRLAPGVYWVEWQQGVQRYRQKLLKKE